MTISDFIARIVTQRRGYVWLGMAALAAICLLIFGLRVSLDSDVLNMLPSKRGS